MTNGRDSELSTRVLDGSDTRECQVRIEMAECGVAR